MKPRMRAPMVAEATAMARVSAVNCCGTVWALVISWSDWGGECLRIPKPLYATERGK